MRSFCLFVMLLPLFSFSQEVRNALWNKRNELGDGFKGVSIGLLFEGQTKYTNPYYGPKVGGLYDEVAYHFTFDVYYKKIILGFQLSVEELATIKEHAGNIIKNLDAY